MYAYNNIIYFNVRARHTRYIISVQRVCTYFIIIVITVNCGRVEKRRKTRDVVAADGIIIVCSSSDIGAAAARCSHHGRLSLLL